MNGWIRGRRPGLVRGATGRNVKTPGPRTGDGEGHFSQRALELEGSKRVLDGDRWIGEEVLMQLLDQMEGRFCASRRLNFPGLCGGTNYSANHSSPARRLIQCGHQNQGMDKDGLNWLNGRSG